MNTQIINIAYSTYVNKGMFALLLGSGISRKSGIPTGWEITLDLINQLALCEKKHPLPDCWTWYKNYYGVEPDYSDILEKLTNTSEERLNLLKPFIEPSPEEFEEGLKIPTLAHRQVARLVKEGYIKVVITTNFDRLLENALKAVGVEPVVISNPSHIENVIPLIHSKITIIKINGDYLDPKFLNIKSELENYDVGSESLLRFIFENFGLITCGWSAKWDIALVDIMKSSNKFRYSNYFTYLGNADDSLVALSSFRQGELVKISDADHFFTELMEGVEALEMNGASHPLAPAVSLARLKKYLSKEEHLIAFHDLLHQVTYDTIEKLKPVLPKYVPALETIKEVMEAYWSMTEHLSILILNGSYWAKEYQFDIIIRSIRWVLIENDNANTASYNVWNDIRYFPALIIRYVCGISCVASGNIMHLRKLAALEFKTSYSNRLLLDYANQWRVVDKEYLNKISGRNHYTPMSELLFSRLRPYFQELIPVDSDFSDIFDQHEFLISIKHFQFDSEGYSTYGRFAHSKRDFISELQKELDVEKNQHELIKSGFFDSSENLKSTLIAYKDVFGKKIFR